MSGRSQRRNLAVSLLFTVFGGPGIAGVYLPAAITRWRIPPSPASQRALAWTLIALALLPLLESIARFVWAGRGTLAPFAPTETLVVSGFYRHVRNPMYVGVLTAVAGQAVLFRSLALVAYGVLLALGFHLFVTRYEEPTLRKKYAGYEAFCRNVPRWIPRWTAWHG
jgi:protein-S-isoprenylcysteine O-methyltransferase Ste14